jgi:hypothetical protein
MKLNYRRVRIIGRCVLGLFFAGVITFAIYKIGHSKTELIIVFLPIFVLLFRAIDWTWSRGRKHDQEIHRSWYEATSGRF